MNCASRLDTLTESTGEITLLASNIVDKNDTTATINLLKRLSQFADNKDCSKQVKLISKELKDCLINYFGYLRISEICNNCHQDEEDVRTLAELLDELNELIGLSSVKSKINDLIAFQKVQKMRQKNDLNISQNTLHLAFIGNPGTGKTTVARIVGRIYKHIGLLSKGHFVEVSRTDLIAGYQGQTALKVKKVIDQARGGVLFIDEAYSITENDHSDSYGRECLTELTKALEDYRDDLVVIVAGYTAPMKKFFESNPGLKSRFNTFIEFDDYSCSELMDILALICKNNDYFLSDDLKEKITLYLTELINSKSEEDSFANGRLMRNIFDDLVISHAKRVVNMKCPNKETLSMIIAEDFKIKE